MGEVAQYRERKLAQVQASDPDDSPLQEGHQPATRRERSAPSGHAAKVKEALEREAAEPSPDSGSIRLEGFASLAFRAQLIRAPYASFFAFFSFIFFAFFSFSLVFIFVIDAA